MSKALLACGAVLALALFTSSAFAQCGDANPRAVAEWNHYLQRHQGLREHPGWLNNGNYEKDHPNMMKWLHDHPHVLACSRQEGMWDNQGNWRNANWWRSHNPNWMYQHHPEWAENHPDWQGPNDGDYDDEHHWHNRGWWTRTKADWVRKHHPDWFTHTNAEPGHDHDHDHDE